MAGASVVSTLAKESELHSSNGNTQLSKTSDRKGSNSRLVHDAIVVDAAISERDEQDFESYSDEFGNDSMTYSKTRVNFDLTAKASNLSKIPADRLKISSKAAATLVSALASSGVGSSLGQATLP
jgi:hypothetical protein